MKIKRFFAKDMRTALAEVKEALGADAVIMSNKKVTGGVEIVAAVDTETPTRDTRQDAARTQMAQSMDRVHQQRRLVEDKVHVRRDINKEAARRPLGGALGSKFSSLLDRYQSQLPESQVDDEPGKEMDSLTALLARQKDARLRQTETAYAGQSSSSRRDAGASQGYGGAPQQSSQSAGQNRSGYGVSQNRGSSQNQGSSQNTSQHARNQQAKGQELDRLYRQKRDEADRRDMRGNGRQENRLDATRVESRKNAPRQTDEMEAMRKEMATIRGLLEHQLSGLMWQEVERKEPLRAMLIKRLEKMGLSPVLADQLAGYIPEDTPPNEAWSELLDLVADQVITTDENLLETGGVIALLGPTGVGKTTTIAKLAARAAMDFGPEDIALVTTDTFRIGAHEQLATYGRILGCPVKVAKDAEALADILYQLRHRRLILLDTAGMGQRDLRLSEQLDTLIQSSGSHIRSLLVLPATSQRRVLQETIDHFRRIPLSGCVLTKLDESLSLGELLSVTIENALPVTYLADGQRVPEDIRQASGRYLVNKASELMAQDSEQQNHFWSHDVPESNAADFYD
ncbi:flagellar biosynthesis protein FlhF [Enterovibrio norvegicus]|uniref:flagellar biosynthesis protein FlhF n=1 Tax=Enterovibrio norvegicus TaxID=188144 RepID=UPI000C867C28|nr:flagellar biosynthesis protein FlhF [Enterovibrio norvegicus]MCC4797806.1 flagellar biosynthesis protein FlhF [Enterovibrio norvegicus]PMI32949.1 flagellar biosynthesis protein FlhF [Enterovibrio norvegicus]PMI33913.1 flagellar biosynthesis protein FlhF [Enterovibrio norvegicus]PMN53100.1 flagellar biosynthesis protein FlhF [Enterovibrio norvegicus]TKF12726.1 flagellar biosynthesis protein FlhF [Enterovibrio norvegicus]